MQTSTVVNPVNVLISNAPSAKPEDLAPPATPFKQVLNREVNARQPAHETKPQASRQATSPGPVKQQEPHKSESGVRTTASAGQRNADDKKIQSAKEDQAETDDTNASTTDTASAQLLALVANLEQLATKPADSTTDTSTSTKDSDTEVSDQALLTDPTAIAVDGMALAAMNASQAARTAQSGLNKPTAEEPGIGIDNTKAADDGRTPNAGIIGDVATDGKPQAKEPPLTADARIMSRPEQSQSKSDTASQFDAAAIKKQDVMQALASTQDKPPVLADAAIAPIQQAAMHVAQASQATEKLTAPVGSPGWDQALGQKIVWMVAGAQQSASLTLNPPDLGPLQVVLNVSNDQATATFTAAQPEVREALEAAMPRLREMLNEAGIQLGQANVNAQAQGQQSGYGDQQRQPRQQGNEPRTELADTSASVVRTPRTASGSGLVDTFA